MRKLTNIDKKLIDKEYRSPDKTSLQYHLYGKSKNIMDYDNEEVKEMLLGVYKHTKMLLVDGDYFVNMNDVTDIICVLSDVTFIKKPTLEDFRTNRGYTIKNIRTFYVKNYFLVTQNNNKMEKHKITKYLYNIGALRPGRGKYSGSFSIANSYATMLNGKYPKDLFHPIKRYINGFIFNDDYKISNFSVESNFTITT